MGQEQSSEAGPSAEEQAATKIQAIKRGQAARRRNPLSYKDYKDDGKSTMMEITMSRKKKSFMSSRPGKLGIELDPDNRIVSLIGSAADSDLKPGDFILEVDGFELGDEMLVAVLEKNNLTGPKHVLKIRRPLAA